MRIKSMRESKNMTQNDLAEKMGVGRTAISMWESGESLPRASMLVKLATVLGCTVDELLREAS